MKRSVCRSKLFQYFTIPNVFSYPEASKTSTAQLTTVTLFLTLVDSMITSTTTTTTTTTTTSVFDSPWVNGLGGLSHGSLFRISDAVDTTKPPGQADTRSISPQAVEPWKDVIRKIVTFESFLYSPNLSWFLMACVVWHFFPYPEVSKDFSLTTFLQKRWLLNSILAFGYVGFWHITLYILHWCRRPFVPDRTYNLQRVLHNMFYTMWGVLHWTLVETGFVYCYQTERLTLKNRNMTTADYCVMMTIAMWTPSFRDVHFYLCHRLIHIRWLYKYIHSLHHRNIDVEPFSGLAMHPVEHLYYFTCYGPLLLPVLSRQPYAPFLVFWMNFHTALSPAAAHSGWEDHFSADLTHYLHHRYCDCNYGAAMNFDSLFGTYQPCIKGSDCKDNESRQKDKQAMTEIKMDIPEGWCPHGNRHHDAIVYGCHVAVLQCQSLRLIAVHEGHLHQRPVQNTPHGVKHVVADTL